MNTPESNESSGGELFRQARMYDSSINWSARLERELPVLMEVFGPPGDGGIVDAGCGTGRQAIALAGRGYRVVGTDAGEEMLKVARELARETSSGVEFMLAPYSEMRDSIGTGFDGIYCLGNALAAAGSAEAVFEAVEQFGKCLRPGGRLFLQVLNFEPMRCESPCVRGPRVATVDGQEYISVRLFRFSGEFVEVTNVTLWDDGSWHKIAHMGRLYPITIAELEGFCTKAGLRLDDAWGSYAREPFDVARSTDLLITATRM